MKIDYSIFSHNFEKYSQRFGYFVIQVHDVSFYKSLFFLKPLKIHLIIDINYLKKTTKFLFQTFALNASIHESGETSDYIITQMK